MAIDYNSGISSLNTGAPDITYSGNEGPQSPQRQMQQRQMQQQQQMATLVQEYEDYVMSQEEAGKPAMPFEEWVKSIQSSMAYGGTARPTYTQSRRQRINAAGGGIMGSNAGSMLVAPTADGSRPGYGWADAWDVIKKVGQTIVPGGDPGYGGGGGDSGEGAWDTIKKIGQTIVPGGETGYADLYGWLGGDGAKAGEPTGMPQKPPGFEIPMPQGVPGGGDPGMIYKAPRGGGGQDIFEMGKKAITPNIPSIKELLGTGVLGSEMPPTVPTRGPMGDPMWDPPKTEKPSIVTHGRNFLDQMFGGAKADTTGITNTGKTDVNKILENVGIGGDQGVWGPGVPHGGMPTPDSGGFDWRKALATVLPGGDTGYIDLYGGTGKKGEDPSIFRQAANIAVPLGIGKWAHDYQKEWLKKQPKSIPDTSGIDIADIRRRAKTGSDPGLHFLPPPEATEAYGAAQGGRIGAFNGGIQGLMPRRGRVMYPGGYAGVIDRNIANLQKRKELFPDDWTAEDEAELQKQIDAKGGVRDKLLSGDPVLEETVPEETVPEEEGILQKLWPFAQGGRIRAQEGGLMNLGGMEKDYRQEGGFVPIGGQERADDVPARLSKNEFVFTADAVRSAGGGDIDKGAEVMENVMNNLEQGGQISEESQGLEGARNMFATAQRLEGVM